MTFKKIVEAYRARDFIAVDVNENHVAAPVDNKAYLLETCFRDIVLGHYCRRKGCFVVDGYGLCL